VRARGDEHVDVGEAVLAWLDVNEVDAGRAAWRSAARERAEAAAVAA
jgi:hypothetical protein